MNTKIASIIGLTVAGIIFLFYIFCLNHIGINEVGVAYNSRNGELLLQTNAGWYITSPLVKVIAISTLPQTVRIPTEANIIATKIVKFRAEHAIEFVKFQGFSYDTSGNLNNILMGYAFSGKNYDFLEIVQDSMQVTNK